VRQIQTGLLRRFAPRNDGEEFGADTLPIVMRGLDPRIHAFPALSKTWMAGSSPAMTDLMDGRVIGGAKRHRSSNGYDRP
jgi:hypothetical protein